MTDMAVAYNRVKPHMEASGRPVIQIGSDSITSGVKSWPSTSGISTSWLHGQRRE